MRNQLSLLESDRGDRLRVWLELPQSTRQQIIERLADLLLRSARQPVQEERSVNEEQANDTR